MTEPKHPLDELNSRLVYGALLANASMDLARLRAGAVVSLVQASIGSIDPRGPLGVRVIDQLRAEAQRTDAGWLKGGAIDAVLARPGPLGLSAVEVLASIRQESTRARELLVWRLVCGLLPGAVAAWLGAPVHEIAAELRTACAALAARLCLKGDATVFYLQYGTGDGGLVTKLEQTLQPLQPAGDVVGAAAAAPASAVTGPFHLSRRAAQLPPPRPNLAAWVGPPIDPLELRRVLDEPPPEAPRAPAAATVRWPELTPVHVPVLEPLRQVSARDLTTALRPVIANRVLVIVPWVDAEPVADPSPRPCVRDLTTVLRPSLEPVASALLPWGEPDSDLRPKLALPPVAPAEGETRSMRPVPFAPLGASTIDDTTPVQLPPQVLARGPVAPLPMHLRAPLEAPPRPGSSEGGWRVGDAPTLERPKGFAGPPQREVKVVPAGQLHRGWRPFAIFGGLTVLAALCTASALVTALKRQRGAIQLRAALVPRSELPVGTLLYPELLEVRQVWANSLPDDALTPDMSSFPGLELKVAAAAGEPLAWSHFATATRERLSAQVVGGGRAYALAVSVEGGVGLHVRPGDTVDLVAVLEPEGEVLVAAEDVTVLATGAKSSRLDRAGGPTAEYQDVSLLVPPRGAERLALVAQQASYRFTLRNRGDHELLGARPLAVGALFEQGEARP